ncbi:unnamed protein product, partial [Brenthis ino]
MVTRNGERWLSDDRGERGERGGEGGGGSAARGAFCARRERTRVVIRSNETSEKRSALHCEAAHVNIRRGSQRSSRPGRGIVEIDLMRDKRKNRKDSEQGVGYRGASLTWGLGAGSSRRLWLRSAVVCTMPVADAVLYVFMSIAVASTLARGTTSTQSDAALCSIRLYVCAEELLAPTPLPPLPPRLASHLAKAKRQNAPSSNGNATITVSFQ